MKYKDIKLQIKNVTAEGQFEGYASTFGNEDLGGDIVAQGAFSKTISENKAVPILWGHSTREVIGINKEFSEDSKGLFVKGQLILDVQRARETHALMKEGAVKGLSIGYDPVVVDYSRMEKENIRILKEVKLWEYSVTPFPMNPEATVTQVKTVADFEQLLCELIAYKGETNLSAEKLVLIEKAQKRLSALQAAQAPEAATHDNIAPEILHAKLNSIESLLKGESRGN